MPHGLIFFLIFTSYMISLTSYTLILNSHNSLKMYIGWYVITLMVYFKSKFIFRWLPHIVDKYLSIHRNQNIYIPIRYSTIWADCVMSKTQNIKLIIHSIMDERKIIIYSNGIAVLERITQFPPVSQGPKSRISWQVNWTDLTTLICFYLVLNQYLKVQCYTYYTRRTS